MQIIDIGSLGKRDRKYLNFLMRKYEPESKRIVLIDKMKSFPLSMFIGFVSGFIGFSIVKLMQGTFVLSVPFVFYCCLISLVIPLLALVYLYFKYKKCPLDFELLKGIVVDKYTISDEVTTERIIDVDTGVLDCSNEPMIKSFHVRCLGFDKIQKGERLLLVSKKDSDKVYCDVTGNLCSIN